MLYGALSPLLRTVLFFREWRMSSAQRIRCHLSCGVRLRLRYGYLERAGRAGAVAEPRQAHVPVLYHGVARPVRRHVRNRNARACARLRVEVVPVRRDGRVVRGNDGIVRG